MLSLTILNSNLSSLEQSPFCVSQSKNQVTTKWKPGTCFQFLVDAKFLFYDQAIKWWRLSNDFSLLIHTDSIYFQIMPLEKPRPRLGRFGKREHFRVSVRNCQYTVPDFIDFHIYLPTFLWQLRRFVEKVMRKRLSDSFIPISTIVRLSANSSCVSHHDQRLCQTFLLQFGLLFK